MLTKTKIALAAALIVGSASVALADGEFDGSLGNRYPAYNGPVAAQGTFYNAPVAARGTLQSAPVALRHNGQLRTAPVRLQGGEGFNAPTQGAGRLPHAFIDQQQPGYPQSPPGGGY
jgi:hypothetical protein